MKLSTRFALFGLVSTLVPLLAILGFLVGVAGDSLKSQVTDSLETSADLNARRLQADMEQSVLNMRAWSKLRVMQDVLIDDATQELLMQLFELLIDYPQFTWLAVVNERGEVISATHPDHLRARLDDAQISLRVTSSYPNQYVRNSPRVSEHTLLLQQPSRAPYHSDTVIGGLIGELDWSYMTSHLSEMLPQKDGAMQLERLGRHDRSCSDSGRMVERL